MPEDIIYISGLKANCLIGTYDWEQEVKQEVLFDISLSYDMSAAASSDDVRQVVDYTAISQRVIEFAQTSHYQLVEALASATVNLILNEFDVQRCALTLHKPNAVPAANDVSVRIERAKL